MDVRVDIDSVLILRVEVKDVLLRREVVERELDEL